MMFSQRNNTSKSLASLSPPSKHFGKHFPISNKNTFQREIHNLTTLSPFLRYCGKGNTLQIEAINTVPNDFQSLQRGWSSGGVVFEQMKADTFLKYLYLLRKDFV